MKMQRKIKALLFPGEDAKAVLMGKGSNFFDDIIHSWVQTEAPENSLILQVKRIRSKDFQKLFGIILVTKDNY
jgi:hypothetical protein